MSEKLRKGTDAVPKDTDPRPLPQSLRKLYSNYIAYAGWAPPSKNPLDVTVSNFKEYVGEGSPTAWAMQSLVLKDTHLDQLNPVDLVGLPISIVLTGRDIRSAQHTIERLAALNEQGLSVKSIEAKVQSLEEMEVVMGQLPIEIYPYFEIQTSRVLIAQIEPEPAKFGLKARLTGTENVSPADVAAFLVWKGRKKVTSGIHYPFTGINPDSGRHDYGNVNVSVAAVAAYMDGFWLSDIECILREENPENFSFSDIGIHFYGDTLFKNAALEDIEKTRAHSIHSIGTCSALRIISGLEFAGR